MPGWTFADFWERAADARPDAPFAMQGDRVVTWGDADRRAAEIQTTLVDLADRSVRRYAAVKRGRGIPGPNFEQRDR